MKGEVDDEEGDGHSVLGYRGGVDAGVKSPSISAGSIGVTSINHNSLQGRFGSHFGVRETPCRLSLFLGIT